MTTPHPRPTKAKPRGKALRVVRAERKADRDTLIRLVLAYTKKDRADVSAGEPEMVAAWLAICRLAGRLRRAKRRSSR